MYDGKYTGGNFSKTRKPEMRNVWKLHESQWNQQHLRRSGFSHYPLVSRETFVSGRHCFQHAASFKCKFLFPVLTRIYVFLPSPMYRPYFFPLPPPRHSGRLFCLRRQLNLYWCHVSCGWQFANETKR